MRDGRVSQGGGSHRAGGRREREDGGQMDLPEPRRHADGDDSSRYSNPGLRFAPSGLRLLPAQKNVHVFRTCGFSAACSILFTVKCAIAFPPLTTIGGEFV